MESISEITDQGERFEVGHGWVSPESPNRMRCRIALERFEEKVRDYSENSSLVGCRYLTEPNRFWFERALWVVLHASTLCMMGLLVKSACKEYYQVPVISVVDSENYPSHMLEFPGIAICNINRISRKAAIELANDIINTNTTEWGFVDVLRMIQELGALYDMNVRHNATSGKYLDELLMQYYKRDYDVTSIMKNLSPSCTEGLSSCHFQGEAKNCSEIFTFRKTRDGFCCTFNYIREPDDIPTTEDIKKKALPQPYDINSFGIMNGLSLVLEPLLEDYYYSMLPIMGWKVTIFNTRNYPDNGSGSVAEALVSPATETFVELDATSTYSTNEIRSVAFDRRKCIFKTEFPVLYTLYTYSDCLVDCRAAVIWETCKCRPFFLPRRGKDEYERKVCTAGDVECLHENKELFLTVLASDDWDPENDENKSGISNQGLDRCSNCLPTCNDVRYYLHSSTIHLDRGVYHNDLIDNVKLANQSIVHIYFTKHGSIRLKQEIAYYWYKLLSNIGGICGVFIGFSLISIAEFLYFALRIFGELILREKETITADGKIASKRRGKIDENYFPATLYWNEFLAYPNVNKNIRRFRNIPQHRY